MKISQRIYEIDLIRSLGVICMIIFHIAFDMDYLSLYDFFLGGFPWVFISRLVQIIFILMAGITYALSYERSLTSGKRNGVLKRLKHACVLFGFGMLITAITWVFFRDEVVKFGILHFFALATILTIPLSRLKMWNGILGIFVLITSLWIPKFDAPGWLYPLGLNVQVPTDLDYFPLFPWYGLFLVGVGLASVLIRFWPHYTYKPFIRNNLLEKIGRNSLLIYLLHQPIIWGILQLYLYIQEKMSL